MKIFLCILALTSLGSLTKADQLKRYLCFVDGVLSDTITDQGTCTKRVPEGQLGKNLYVEQTFNGKEWVTSAQFPQCPTGFDSTGRGICAAFAIRVDAASPSAGQTRAFYRPPPRNRCELNNQKWKYIRGKLKCVRKRIN